jgi:hypothetical protein
MEYQTNMTLKFDKIEDIFQSKLKLSTGKEYKLDTAQAH